MNDCGVVASFLGTILIGMGGIGLGAVLLLTGGPILRRALRRGKGRNAKGYTPVSPVPHEANWKEMQEESE